MNILKSNLIYMFRLQHPLNSLKLACASCPVISITTVEFKQKQMPSFTGK